MTQNFCVLVYAGMNVLYMEYAQPTVNLSLGADTQGEENHFVRIPSDSLHHSVCTNSRRLSSYAGFTLGFSSPACPGHVDGHNMHTHEDTHGKHVDIDAYSYNIIRVSVLIGAS